MSEKVARRKAGAGATPMTNHREGFAYEVYQDIQEYIHQRYRRPTLIIVREPCGTLTPCFPRERVPGFCRTCTELRESCGLSEAEFPCVLADIEKVKLLLDAAERGQQANWEGHACPMGLMELLFPISVDHTKTTSASIKAVLVVGHDCLLPGVEASHVHRSIERLASCEDEGDRSPTPSPEVRKDLAAKLHDAASQLSTADSRRSNKIRSELSGIMELLRVFARHALRSGVVAKGEEFVHSLEPGRITLDITDSTLWNGVRRALRETSQHLGFDTAVCYASTHDNYSEMKRKVVIPQATGVAKGIYLRSYEDFVWLTQQPGVLLPSDSEEFSWLTPEDFFGTPKALIFAGEMITGHCVILGLGHSDTPIEEDEKRIAARAVQSRILPFVENALFALELDYLMAETGHLMGRACAKLERGLRRVSRSCKRAGIDIAELKGEDPELLATALWGVEDGLMRLKLIRHNFYSFRRLAQSNRDGENESSPAVDPDRQENPDVAGDLIVDVARLLRGLEPHIVQMAREAELKKPRFHFGCDEVAVVGDPNRLKLVFLNLFDNAVKFGYKNTFIDVGVEKRDGRCLVTICNLGLGVAPDEIDRMFRRLRRSRYRDPHRMIDGLGLGLPFCRRVLADEFDGKISLSSRPVHTPNPRFEGDNWLTTVVVELPIGRTAEGNHVDA